MANVKYSELFEVIACPVCGSQNQKPYFKIEYAKLKQKSNLDYTLIGIDKDTVLSVDECKNCKFVFVNPRINLNIKI